MKSAKGVSTATFTGMAASLLTRGTVTVLSTVYWEGPPAAPGSLEKT